MQLCFRVERLLGRNGAEVDLKNNQSLHPKGGREAEMLRFDPNSLLTYEARGRPVERPFSSW